MRISYLNNYFHFNSAEANITDKQRLMIRKIIKQRLE